MNVNFTGYQNAGCMVVGNPKAKKIVERCLWTDFNNIGRRDVDKAQELLKKFPSPNGALFIAVDPKNTPLKTSSIRVNGTALKFEDENLGAIGKVAKLLKGMSETENDLFVLDMKYVDKFKNLLKLDGSDTSKDIQKQSPFKLHDSQRVKQMAGQMVDVIQEKMTQFFAA